MNPPAAPNVRTYLSCFLRCYLVGANFNTRGMQNIGLAYAMEPGLAAMYHDATALARARKRHLKHYNTHPFWTPLLVGTFLSLEYDIARGFLPPDTLEKVKSTTTYTLSAIGDSFFSGSLLVMWALGTICLISSGNHTAAVILGAGLFAALQTFKAVTFVLGVKEGFKILPKLKRLDLINWSRRLKYVNCLLLLLFWAIIWPENLVWWHWLTGISLLLGTAWFVSRTGLPRVVALFALIAGYLAWPWLAGLANLLTG